MLVTRQFEEITVRVEPDDIDHFNNRRIRAVGELIQGQIRTGLARMERVVHDRMTTQDVDSITAQSLINTRPVTAAIKRILRNKPAIAVYGSKQSLAGLTHKRRLSALESGWSIT